MINKLYMITVSSHKGASLCAALRRCYSQDIKILKNLDSAHLKRGTGGRSSFSGDVVTVFGATGFLGSYICGQLGSRGAQLIIPYRCDADDTKLKSLKVSGDLGQVLFLPFSLNDVCSIRKAIKYSNVVVNLIGRDIETKNFSSYEVHVKGARAIAEACKEMNVERLIHFSSLNVTETPQRYYVRKLNFLRDKLKGEQAVFEEFPDATVFRPSNIYGLGDRFLWPLCTRLRYTFNSVPLYKGGTQTIKQPVYAADLGKAVASVIADYSTRGKIYQAVGPERYYLRDISRFCSQVLQRHHYTDRLTHELNLDFFYLFKIILIREIIELAISLPSKNIAFEFIERESVTDTVDPNLPTLADLNIPITKFEDVVPHLIYKTFRKYPSMALSSDTYVPPESLSKKAIKDFAF